MPRATLLILALTVAAYAAGNPQPLMINPEPHWWQFVTYAFVHGNLPHIFLNMLALVSFGPALEKAWGSLPVLACYVVAAVIGGLLQHGVLPNSIIAGASASVLALFAAYTLRKPKARIVSVLVVPLPAWTVLALYVALTHAAIYWHWWPEIAHFAHLGGLTVGMAWAANSRKTTKPPHT